MKITVKHVTRTQSIELKPRKEASRSRLERKIKTIQVSSKGLRPRLKYLGHSDLDETSREGDDVMSTLEAEAAHEAYEQDTRSF